MKTPMMFATLATALAGCSMIPGAAMMAGTKATAPAKPAEANTATTATAPAGAETAATGAAPAPLPLDPDDGLVGDAHQQHVGKVVFAKSAKAVTTPESPDAYVTALALSDEIHVRAYQPHSIRNAFRSEGVKCVRDNAFRVWDVAIDGQPATDAGSKHFYMERAASEGPLYRTSTSVRYDRALNAKADAAEKSLWRAFGDVVVPALTAGTHTITLTVSAVCDADRSPDYPRVQLKTPLAVGTFELEVSERALKKAAGELGTQLPKAAMQDKKLEQRMREIVKAQWPNDELFQLAIVDKKWRVELFPETTIPHRRYLDAVITAKIPDGGCKMFRISFMQKSLDGIREWGETEWGGVGGNEDLSCGKAQGQ